MLRSSLGEIECPPDQVMRSRTASMIALYLEATTLADGMVTLQAPFSSNHAAMAVEARASAAP